MIDPPNYYSDERRPLQQGDLVFAPFARLRSGPIPAPPQESRLAAWSALDAVEVRWPADQIPSSPPEIWSVGAYDVAMVTTHDCHLDREFLRRYRQLRDAGVAKAEAIRQAESEPDLDRFVGVSPFLAAPSLQTDWGEIESCRALGLFPVFENESLGVPRGAIDLSHRTTVDRHALKRFAVLGEHARTALRYSLARFDALRTPEIGFELEEAVGKRIKRVRVGDENPSVVVLDLNDDSTLELLMRPGVPNQAGAQRRADPQEAGGRSRHS